MADIRHIVRRVWPVWMVVMLAGCTTYVQRTFTRAEDAVRQGNLVIAESLFTVYLDEVPRDEDGWYNRGLCRAGRGDLSGALKDLERAVQLSPDDLDARWLRFRILEQKIDLLHRDTSGTYLDRPLRAALINALQVIELEELSAFLRLDPMNVTVRCDRGILLRRLGRYDDAGADLSIIIREEPGDVRARTERGNLYHAMGRYQDAIDDYTAALSECDTCQWLLYNMALSLHAAGRLSETVAVLERLCNADSADGEAWLMLGDCRLEQGRPNAACRAWRKSADAGNLEAPSRLATHCRELE